MNIDRRRFLKLGVIGAAGAACASSQWADAQDGDEAKAPIVLVHGAWHGGWCWKRVAPLLRAAGREVFTPTLTGLGERAHLAAPGIDLNMHIADVLGVLEAEELSNVVLVGHSYAGMVITGVADRAGEKLRRLIYLDAFVPEKDHSLMDYIAPERRGAMKKAGEAAGFVDPLPVERLGISDPADREWVTRRMMRQPYATFSQPLHFEHDGAGDLPRTYVSCTNPPTGTFEQFAKRFRNDASWRFDELKTGHDCMITDPKGVARIVLEAA
jgi:pimeloyl-ACP methyl ester carboxylesterase